MPTFEEVFAKAGINPEGNEKPGTGNEGPGFKVVNGIKISTEEPIGLDNLFAGVQGAQGPTHVNYDRNRYDFPVYPGQDPEEIAALNQTGWDLVKAGGANFITAGASAVGETVGTLVASLPTAVYRAANGQQASEIASAFYDNPINRIFENLSEYTHANLPVYRTEELREAPWYEYMLTPEFLADEGATGLGYLAGAYATGKLTGPLLSKFTAGMIRGDAALLKTINGVTAAKNTGIPLATAAGDIKKAVDITKKIINPSIYSQFGVAMTMAMGEASAEANGVKKDTINKLKQQREEGLNTFTDEQIEAISSRASNVDFAINLPIIAITDMFLFGKSVSGGWKAEAKALGKMSDVAKTTETVSDLKKLMPDLMAVEDTKLLKFLDRGKRLGSGFLEEGSQEWAQYIAQMGSTDYYTSRKDGKTTMGIFGAYLDTIVDKGLDKEAIISTLLGGLMGGPTHLLSTKGERNQKFEDTKKAADLINKLPQYLNTIEDINQVIAASEAADEALLNNDEMMFRTFSNTKLGSYAKLVENAGVTDVILARIELLKGAPASAVKEFFNMKPGVELTEEEKNKRLDALSNQIKNHVKAYQDMKIKYPGLSKPVADTVFDAIINIDNFDVRQGKIVDKIQSTIGTKFPNMVIPFDFNEYMILSKEAKEMKTEFIEKGEYDPQTKTFKDNKVTLSSWKHTAKEWVESIKNINPEVYQEIKKDLNDLFRISDLREVYIKNFNQAIEHPEEFKDTAEEEAYVKIKEERIKNIYGKAFAESDIEFYDENTDEDLDAERNPFGFTSNVFTVDIVNPPNDDRKNNLIKFPEKEKGKEWVAPIAYPVAKLTLKLKHGHPLTFVDEKGAEYTPREVEAMTGKSLGELVPTKTYRDVRKEELNKIYQEELKKEIAIIKKEEEEEIVNETAKLQANIKSIRDALKKGNKKKARVTIDGVKIFLTLTELQSKLKDFKVLIEKVKLRKEGLEKRRKELEAKLSTEELPKLIELEELGILKSKISKEVLVEEEIDEEIDGKTIKVKKTRSMSLAEYNKQVQSGAIKNLKAKINEFSLEIRNKEEQIDKLVGIYTDASNLVDKLKILLKGGYTALYNIYKKTYNTIPEEDENYFWDFVNRFGLEVKEFPFEMRMENSKAERIKSELKKYNDRITEGERELEDYPPNTEEYRNKEKSIQKLRDIKEHYVNGIAEEYGEKPEVILQQFEKLTKNLEERKANQDIIINIKGKLFEIEKELKNLEIEKKLINPENEKELKNLESDKSRLRKEQADLLSRLTKFTKQIELQNIPLSVKEKVQHLIEAGKLPADIAKRLAELYVAQNELEDALAKILKLENDIIGLQPTFESSKRFYSALIKQIQRASNLRAAEEAAAEKKGEEKPASAAGKVVQGPEIEVQIPEESDDPEVYFPDGFKKSIWDIFSNTSSGNIPEGDSDSQKRLLNVISRIRVLKNSTDKDFKPFYLRLVSFDTLDKNDPLKKIFSPKNDSDNLLDVTHEKGQKTIGIVIYRDGKPVGIDPKNGSIKVFTDEKNLTPEDYVYGTLPIPSTKHSTESFGDKFHDYVEGEEKSEKQIARYKSFYETVLEKLAVQEVFVEVTGKSNGVFYGFNTKRNSGSVDEDLTRAAYEILGGEQYANSEIYIATDAAGGETVVAEVNGRKMNLKKGYPYLKLANGDYIPLLSRKMTPGEANTIFELIKLYGQGKWKYDENGNLFGSTAPKESLNDKKKKDKSSEDKSSDTSDSRDGFTKFVAKYMKEEGKPWYPQYQKGKKNIVRLKRVTAAGVLEESQFLYRKGKDSDAIYESAGKYVGKAVKNIKWKKDGSFKGKKSTSKSKAKTKAKEEEEAGGNYIFNYIANLVFYGEKVKNGEKQMPVNLDTYFSKIPVREEGKPQKDVIVFADPDFKGTRTIADGMIQVELVRGEDKANADKWDAVKDKFIRFIESKTHHVRHGKAYAGKDEEFLHIEGIDSDTGKLIITKYKNYKQYLLSAKKGEGKDAPVRNANEIPLILPFDGPQIYANMHLIFDPSVIIGKIEKPEVEEKEEIEENEVGEVVSQSQDEADAAFFQNLDPDDIKEQTLENLTNALAGKKEKPIPATSTNPQDEALPDFGTPGQRMEALNSVMTKLDEDYEKSDWDEKKENLRKILPQVTLQRVVNNLIDGKYFGVANDAGVILSDLAVRFAEYHEAFHIISLGILDEKERKIMYGAARSIWGDPSLAQIDHLHKQYPKQTLAELVESFYEEKLAEAFREFMKTGTVEDLEKIAELPDERSVLERLFDIIKSVINDILIPFNINDPFATGSKAYELNKSKKIIYDMFKKIKKGGFSKSSVKSFTGSRYFTYTENITAELNADILSYVTMGFFKRAMSDSDFKRIASVKNEKVRTILTDVVQNEVLPRLNKKIQRLERENSKEANDIINEINIAIKGLGKIKNNEYVYSANFNIAFDNYLRGFGFAFKQSDEGELTLSALVENLGNEASGDIALGGGKHMVEVSAKNTASHLVKLLIASIPALEKNERTEYNEKTGDVVTIWDKDKPYREVLGEYGLPKAVDWRSTSAFLFDQLAGLYDYNVIKEKIRNLTLLKPELQYILDILDGRGGSDYYFTKIFQQAFYNTKSPHMTYLINKDRKIFAVHSVLDSTQKKIKDKWINNIYSSVGEKDSLFEKNKEGRIVIKSNAFLNKLNKTTSKSSNITYDDITDLAKPLGIYFTQPEKIADVSNVYNTLREIYTNAQIDGITTPEDLIKGKFEDKENANQTSRIDFLAEIELRNTIEEISHQFRGPDGEIRQALHRPSYVSKFIDTVNRLGSRDELFRAYPHLNTIQSPYSMMFKLDGYLYDKNGRRTKNVFESSFFTGMKDTESDFGDTTINIAKPNRLIMYFKAAFSEEGTKDDLINLSMIWNSDKSLSPGFITNNVFPKKKFKNGIPDDVVNQFIDYLKYDFRRNRLLLRGTGKNVQFYNKTKGELSIFNEFFAIKEKDSPAIVNIKKQLADRVANFLITDFSDSEIDNFLDNVPGIKALIRDKITEYTKENFDLLTEYKAIVQKGEVYDIAGGDENVSNKEMAARMLSFTVNYMVSYMEQTFYITGNVNSYKSLLEIFKRVSMPAAPKHFASMSEEDNANINRINGGPRLDGKTSNGYINAIALGDMKIQALHIDFLRKSLEDEYGKGDPFVEKLIKSSYDAMNEADGAGIMMLPEYREYLQRTEGIDDKFEAAYIKAYTGTEPLLPEELIYFSPKKLQVSGFIHNKEFLTEDPKDGLAVHVDFKFCVFPAIPSVHNFMAANSTAYFKNASSKGENSIGLFVVEPKDGAILQEDGELESFYTKNAEGDLAYPDEEGILENKNLMKVPYDILGMQVKIKDKPGKNSSLGSQYKKIILSNTRDTGVSVPISYLNKEKTAMVKGTKEDTDNIINKITNAISELTIDGQDKLINSLGLEEDTESTNDNRIFHVVNWKKTMNVLRDKLKRAGISSHILDTIDVEAVGENVIRYKAINPLDSLVNRNRIEGILMSLVNKKVLSPTVPGGSRTLVPISMYDISDRNVVGGRIKSSNTLLSYRLGKFGELLPMQVMMPLPEQFKWLVFKYGSLEAFNDKVEEAVNDRYNPAHKELLALITNVGYRIPIQSPNAIDYCEIVKFLPSESSGIVIAATEIVGKTGADFDKDEMYFIMPSWKEIIPKLNYNSTEFSSYFHTQLTDKLKGKVNEFRKKLADFEYKIYVGKDVIKGATKKSKNISKKIYNEYKGTVGLLEYIAQGYDTDELLNFTEEELKLVNDIKTSYIEKHHLPEEMEIYMDDPDAFELEGVLSGTYETKEERLAKKEGRNSKINTLKGSAINKLIQNSIKILASPEMRGDLLTPNNAVHLKEYAETMDKIFDIEKDPTDKMKLLLWAFQMNMSDLFISGTKLIGRAVLQQNNHILAQQAGLKVNPEYTYEVIVEGKRVIKKADSEMHFEGFKGKEDYNMGSVYDINKDNPNSKEKPNKIINIISEYDNGYVDAVKNTFVFSINAGEKTQNTHMYLLRRRVPVKLVNYFLNQPIIKEYVKQSSIEDNEFYGVLTNEQIIYGLVDKYTKKLGELVNLDEENMVPSALNYITLKALQDSFVTYSKMKNPENEISKDDLITYYKTQIKVLKDFENYKRQAEITTGMVVNTAIDTHETRSMEENYVYNYKSENIFKETLFERTSLERMINETFLKTYKNVQEEVKDMFSDMFIMDTPQIQNVFKRIINPFLDNKFIQSKLATKAAEKVKTDILTFVFHVLPSIPTANGSVSLSDIYSRFIKPIKGKVGSSESFFEALRKAITLNRLTYNKHTYVTLMRKVEKSNFTKAKKDKMTTEEIEKLQDILRKIELLEFYKKNSVLKELVTELNEKKYKTEGIKLLNKQRLPHEQDIFIEDFMKLFKSTLVVYEQDGKVITMRDIANNLAYYAIIQSGISYSPYSFIDKLPPQKYSNLVKNAINAFTKLSSIDKMKLLDLFEEQFFRNNYKDSTLVPAVKRTRNPYTSPEIEGNELKAVSDKQKYNSYRYLKMWDRELDSYRLFKALEYNKQLKTYAKYVEIPKLGDGALFKEFYNELKLSIIRGNNIFVKDKKYRDIPVGALGSDITIDEKGEKIIETTEEEKVKNEGNTQYKGLDDFNKLPGKSEKPTFTYAGIGSRETPKEILKQMFVEARNLEKIGFTLNTGKQKEGKSNKGADLAFEKGVKEDKNKHLFGPEDATELTKKIATQIHPKPEKLTKDGLDLMARNTNQVFGEKLDTPVDFILTWTQDGLTDYKERTVSSGGTGQAIDMASRKGIPVINMANKNWKKQLDEIVQNILSKSKKKTSTEPVKKETKIQLSKEKIRFESLSKDLQFLLRSKYNGKKYWSVLTATDQENFIKCNTK